MWYLVRIPVEGQSRSNLFGMPRCAKHLNKVQGGQITQSAAKQPNVLTVEDEIGFMDQDVGGQRLVIGPRDESLGLKLRPVNGAWRSPTQQKAGLPVAALRPVVYGRLIEEEGGGKTLGTFVRADRCSRTSMRGLKYAWIENHKAPLSFRRSGATRKPQTYVWKMDLIKMSVDNASSLDPGMNPWA